jgi:hypothetical protein
MTNQIILIEDVNLHILNNLSPHDLLTTRLINTLYNNFILNTQLPTPKILKLNTKNIDKIKTINNYKGIININWKLIGYHKNMYNIPNLKILYLTNYGYNCSLNLLPTVTELHLCDVPNIASCDLKNFPNLKILNLSANLRITDLGLKHIPNLKSLNLSFNIFISDEGLKYTPNLKILYLTYNTKITDLGLKNIPKLKELHLGNNENITSKGILSLKNLKKLNLYKNYYVNTDKLINPNFKIINKKLLINYKF